MVFNSRRSDPLRHDTAGGIRASCPTTTVGTPSYAGATGFQDRLGPDIRERNRARQEKPDPSNNLEARKGARDAPERAIALR
jgi:hypothetical protein